MIYGSFFAYVKVPKTGSSSLSTALFNAFLRTNAVGAHITAEEAKHFLGETRWENFFTFGVVRNPWAWAYSAYNHAKEDIAHFGFVPGLPYDPSWSFEEFVQYMHRTPLSWLTTEKGEDLVDKIYRLEDIDTWDLPQYLHVELHLPKYNARLPDNEYRNFYTARAKDIIADKGFREIERFEYEY